MQLLDFTNSIENEYFVAYKVYESKEVCVLSKSLQLSTSSSGKPAFLLEAVRGITPFSKPSPYAQLEMQIEPSNLNESILTEISKKWPGLQVQFSDINSGFLMFTLFNDEDDDSASELNTPIPLSSLPLSRLRIVKQLSNEYMNLFQLALKKEVLLMSAKGWYSVNGYAPLVESIVNFNPVKLTNSVKSFISNEEGCIIYDELFLLFRDKVNLLPIHISTTIAAGDYFATTLTTRYLEYFCEPVPSLNISGEITFKFNELAMKEGDFTWDLLKPQVVKRYISYILEGLGTMHDMIKEGKFPEYMQTRIVESLPTGFTQISIYHPFFMLPVGIRQVGIKISAAPVETHRLQAINETITFDSGTAKKIVTLKFSSREKCEYDVLPFVIVEENGFTNELYGESFTSNENILFIQEEQFPLHIITFECSEDLMGVAEIKLDIVSDEEEKECLPSTSFSREQSSVMYAFSNMHEKGCVAKVTASVNEIDSKILSKSFNLNNDVKIDFTSFDCFGSHAVNIKLKQEINGLIAIDLLPESLEELHENITTIALSKDKPEQTWQWYTSSLFKSGFRYRLPLSGIEWSEVLPYDLNELIIP